MDARMPPKGKVTMTLVSRATKIGQCWLCGRGKRLHWLVDRIPWHRAHPYDPIREPGGFKEIQRLHKKYGGA